ncbi:hypothetical protein MMC25_001819 [Agyrium rufum]|nr:hypothetical protein [Agyrium rufum]
MDTVHTLGATSTIGVAAVGLAFGRPQTQSPPPRRGSREDDLPRHTRRPGHFSRPSSAVLTSSPSDLSPTSSPVPRPGSSRRPQSSTYPNTYTPYNSAWEKGGWQDAIPEQEHTTNTVEDSLGDISFAGSDIGKSTWFRRMSSFTASRNGSPSSTPRPSTPSVSFSNASNAPILSGHLPIRNSMPRNRLVKRTSSSQGPLWSSPISNQTVSKSKIPTLRRPATSHQRSATLLQQYKEEELVAPQSGLNIEGGGGTDMLVQAKAEAAQIWYPYFQPQRSRSLNEQSLRKRTSPDASTASEFVSKVSSVDDSFPILLLGSAVSAGIAEKDIQGRMSSADYASSLFRPRTPLEGQTQKPLRENRSDPEPKGRNSFSISDLLPTSSPSSWKMKRGGSLRQRTGFDNIQSSKSSKSTLPIPFAPLLSKTNRSNPAKMRRSNTSSHFVPSPSSPETQTILPSRSASSPLPPIDRMSAFELEIPSLPTSTTTSPLFNSETESFQVSHFSPIAHPSSDPPVRSQIRTATYRPSAGTSDRASTIIESDTENSRLFSDADEPDSRSETVYDSIRTGASGSSHSGVRGPRIESVFDESAPPDLLKRNLALLQKSLGGDFTSEPRLQQDLILEEEESVGTPVGLKSSREEYLQTPSRVVSHKLDSPHISSSPPEHAFNISDHDSQGIDFKTPKSVHRWTMGDETDDDLCWDDDDVEETVKHHHSPVQFLPPLLSEENLSAHTMKNDSPKVDLSKWSEKSHPKQSSIQGSSPRYGTVHGKSSKERGSRATGRRGPSNLHLRSQSVPLPPDGNSHRGQNTTAQLDAWLLGNKGASELWDEDFVLDSSNAVVPHPDSQDLDEFDEGDFMVIPQAILERQASVQGQFGHVKELTHLVEELKRLRIQGQIHGLLHSQSAELWKEAEGIINLATVDEEGQELLPPRSPRSPGDDLDPFEEESPARRHRRDPSATPPPDHAVIRGEKSAMDHSAHPSPASLKLGHSHGRPRKESIATAKTVLEHIHQQRSKVQFSKVDIKTTQRKMPFDTTSLRDLVTRAGVVTRALKEIVRKADEAPDTPQILPSTPPDPPFVSHIFQQSSPRPHQKSPRPAKSPSGHGLGGGSLSPSSDNEINGRMKIMTVV